jgi:hypothetical protein
MSKNGKARILGFLCHDWVILMGVDIKYIDISFCGAILQYYKVADEYMYWSLKVMEGANHHDYVSLVLF